ncbi:MAG: serine/threonine-protein phosphatase [Lachnospiraceae bacterium]|nr:serine/threonine-protein phosphatase [Lachnospiraceae bacterium]
MKYLTSVYWERGNVADNNQDSLILLQVLTGRGRVLMAAVCDGMGGLAQGEVASGYVTRRLQEWFYGPLLRAIRKRKAYWVIRRSLDRLVYHMQEQLSQYAKQEGICLGTTMTVLIIWEKTYLLWHLGDSRVYRLCISGMGKGNKDGAECLTSDHVRGNNRLTKCVGSFGYERPDFKMGIVKAGQAMLLCSDGFRHCVTGREISDVLAPKVIAEEEQASRRLREIGEVCMKRGERDNISAVYIKAVK